MDAFARRAVRGGGRQYRVENKSSEVTENASNQGERIWVVWVATQRYLNVCGEKNSHSSAGAMRVRPEQR